MSKSPSQAEKLNYVITYSQLSGAEPGNPTFEITKESLVLLNGTQRKSVFDRDHSTPSPLKHAARYVDTDYGILAAVRKAAFDGRDDGIQIVSDCSKEIGRFNRFRLAPSELSKPSRIPDLVGDSVPPSIMREPILPLACTT